MIEYNKNYRKAAGSFWRFYRDEPNNPPADNYNADPIANSKSFKHEKSITGNTIDYNLDEKITDAEGNEIDNPPYDAKDIGTKEVKIVMPLQYLSNFGRNLDMPLINSETN